jgi:hypothetical protein
VAAILIVTQGATGLAGTVDRVRIADPNSKEGEDFRHRHAVVARWIREHTDPADEVAVDSVMLKAKFQLAFYLERKRRKLRLRESTKTLSVGPRTAMAVVDLRRAPHLAARRLQVEAVRKHPVTVIEDFLIVDLRRKVDAPDVTWWRLEARPASWAHRWLVSTIYSPHELIRDPWLEAELLRSTGHESAALERRKTAPTPETVRQHVAQHNLARLANESPAPVASWLSVAGTVLDEPVSHGGKLSLLGYAIRSIHRKGEVVEAVFRIDAAPGRGWRPFFNRHGKRVGKEEREGKAPMVARVLAPGDPWKKGDLVVVRAYSGLNPYQDRVRYQLGFWRPGKKRAEPKASKKKGKDSKKKGKKGKKARKPPNKHLMVGSERGVWIDRSSWKGRALAPWPLRWLPHITP